MTIQNIHNRYELKQRLGTGSMGSVYRAFDRLTGDEVALKLVLPNHEITAVDPTTANLALAHEFQVLASLRHPNIIGVLDYGFYNKTTPYFTMTYMRDAYDMRTAAEEHPLKDKVTLLIQLLSGLVYLERRAIVHRDLKPDNVLVMPGDHVKVLDFGLARDYKQVQETELGGTLPYIAPEIFQGHAASHVSDLYAVGVIAYEIFAQQPLYKSDITVNELINQAVSKQPDFKVFLTRITALINGEEDFEPPSNSAPYSTQILDEQFDHAPTISDMGRNQEFSLGDTILMPPEPESSLDDSQSATRPDMPHPSLDENLPDVPIETLDDEEPGFKIALIVQKLLAKKPDQRYQHAEEVIEDLYAAINMRPPAQAKSIRESFLQAARFIGRQTEFKELSEGLKNAMDRQGGLYLIGGESGVGKSRLLAELRHLALVKGVLVLNGQTVQDGSLPYQSWREAVRRLILYGQILEDDAQSLKPIIPDLDRLLGKAVPEPANDENAAQRITEAILNLFRNCPDPILLFLEDWQWAQAESRELLKRLADYAYGTQVLIVVTYRDDEAPTLPEQYPGSKTILLKRLNETDVQELASSILGQRSFQTEFVKTLHRHTEGNVFFIIEALRSLAEEAGSLENVVNITLPEALITGQITQVMQRRLDKISARYRALLDIAAVIGRELNLNLLRELNRGNGIDFEDWLTSMANAAIVEYHDEVWSFSHDKLRQQLLTQLEAPRQKLFHRQVAETIERLYPPEEQAAVLVKHWRGAEDAEKELYYIRIAGEQATRYNAYDEARQLYERALSLTAAPLLVMEFNNCLGGVYEYLSQYELAMQCLDIVLPLAREHNQPTALAEAEHKLAWIYMRQGDVVEATRHGVEALRMAQESKHAALTVRALSALGVIYVVQGDNAQSRLYLEQALPVVKTLNNAYLHATILNTLGAAYEGEGRVDEAITVLKQAGQMAEDLRDRELLANVHGNLGRILYIQKHLDQAKESFLKALPGFSEVGNLYGAALANDYLGLIAVQHRDPKSAGPYLREGIHTGLSIGAQTVALLALCGVARLHIDTNDEQRAVELIGLIRAHEASAGDIDVQRESQSVMEQTTLFELDLQAALKRGEALNFDETVTSEADAL